jgi:sarcosine oxidase
MYDVIVIGVGTMGAAACESLARRGTRVLGLEQFDIPHSLGAHHGHSRMFRTAYYEHPDYVPLLQRSLQLWRDLEARSRTELLYLTGSLYVGPTTPTGRGGGELLPRSIEAAQRYHLVHQMLSHGELKRRFPALRVPDNFVGLLERDGGFVVPERAVGAMAARAISHGADLRGREPVLHWDADSSGVRVRTNRGEYSARSAILAGGPWSAKLCRGLGVDITITRQVLGWIQPRLKGLLDLGRFPCWAVEREDGGLYYGFPELPWHPGFKTALHAKSAPCDPDTVNRTATPDDEAEIREGLKRHLPDADGPLLSMGVCMYDNSPDCHFILDRHPIHPNVIVATGFSGHGFKFAPVIGEALADLATTGASHLPIGFLGLDRFQRAHA